MVLETKRLWLQSSHHDLAKPLADYYVTNRDFLKPFDPERSEEFYSISHQQEILQGEMVEQEARRAYRFYIFLKEKQDRIIGSVSLSNIVWGCFLSCFLGYKLSVKHINLGYMTEAVSGVVRYVFDELNLHRIEANVMPHNKPSLRVLEKCGFTKEGYSPKYLKINGVWQDHVHMVRLNKQM